MRTNVTGRQAVPSRGLKLRTEDYFLTDKNTVTVAERSPQPAFPLHHHDFDELVIV